MRRAVGTKVGIVALRIGDSVDVALAERYRQFYEHTATLVVGSSTCRLIEDGPLRTTAVPQNSVRNNQAIYEYTVGAATKVASTADYLIIDLASPVSENFPVTAIIQGIVVALSEIWWKPDQPKLAILLVNQPLSGSDFAYKIIQPHLDRREIAVVDRRGVLHGRIPNLTFDAKKYESAFLEIQDNPLILMQRRLIRRIGHFRRPPRDGVGSNKFYFDGTQCTNEIAHLLGRLDGWSSSTQLFVYAPISPWLAEAAVAFGVKRGISSYDLKHWMVRSKAAPEIPVSANPNVLVPMVDTGRTLKRIDSCLKRQRPDCQPTYVSVLSTSGDLETGGRRSIESKPTQIDVQYLLRVKQVSFGKGAEPLCCRDHIGSDRDDELRRLTSYEFWEMVEEVGLKNEQDVPTTRPSLGYVPRFPEILQNNGPLLAAKMKRLLSPLPIDAILICADEVGAIELTRCIRSITTCTMVRLPRSTIDKIPLKGEPSNLKAMLERKFAQTEWYKRLMSANGQVSPRAILIDEFRSGGHTLTRLSRLCASLGVPVDRSVVLADFGIGVLPDGSEVDSLYQLPLGVFP
jgi:hypothetical protein